MGRVVIGTVASGVAAFMFGYVFWAVLPMTEKAFEPLPGGDFGAFLMEKGIEESGWYLYPLLESKEGASAEETKKAEEEWTQQAKDGPFIMVSFTKDGSDPADPMYMVKGFSYGALSCLLMALILHVCRFKSFGQRFGMVLLVATFGIFHFDLGTTVWWHAPPSFPMMTIIYHSCSWVIVGLLLAAIVKPPAGGS